MPGRRRLGIKGAVLDDDVLAGGQAVQDLLCRLVEVFEELDGAVGFSSRTPSATALGASVENFLATELSFLFKR